MTGKASGSKPAMSLFVVLYQVLVQERVVGWAKGPLYFIQGRLSTDIIKVGGEKVSALEVERELLSLYLCTFHPSM